MDIRSRDSTKKDDNLSQVMIVNHMAISHMIFSHMIFKHMIFEQVNVNIMK